MSFGPKLWPMSSSGAPLRREDFAVIITNLILHAMRADPGGPHTAARLARAIGVGVSEVQRCLAELERDGSIARPDGSTYPFFHVTTWGMERAQRSQTIGAQPRDSRVGLRETGEAA